MERSAAGYRITGGLGGGLETSVKQIPSGLLDIDALDVGVEVDRVVADLAGAIARMFVPPKGKWENPPSPGRFTWIMPASILSTKVKA